MGSPARSSREISSSYWYVSYTSLGTNKDLYADGPGGIAASVPCRRIHIGSAGSLVLVRPDATSVTVANLQAGDVLDLQAQGITAAGTTVTACLVLW